MKTIALAGALLTLFTGSPASAKEEALAGPRIELFTMGQGEHVFARYGHAALCVTFETVPDKSVCYNYGNFDFRRPIHQSAWQFLRGTAQYWVDAIPRAQMIQLYVRMDRSLWVQRLPLDKEQAKRMIAQLAHDVLEENKYYQYHHFRDNCATRIRDLIDVATDGALSRDADIPIGLSFRELGRQGVAEQTAFVVVANFLLGREADEEITLWEAMFLPRYIREQVRERLDIRPVQIYARRGREYSPEGSRGHAWIAFGGLVLAVPLFLGLARGRHTGTAVKLTVFLLTLAGVLVWLVGAISSVPEIRYNEALLVFWPSDFLLLSLSDRKRVWYARARVTGLALVGVLLALGVFRQPLWAVILYPMLVHGAMAMALPRRRG